MKIGFVISTLNGGGAERVAVVMSDWFLKKGYDIKLIVFDNSNQEYKTNCEVIDLNIGKATSRSGRVLNIFRRIIKLNLALSKEKIDVVISFMAPANFYAGLLKKIHNYQLIITLHNYNDDSNIDGYLSYSFIQKFITKSSDFVVCVSDEIKSKYVRLFPDFKEKIITIHNPYTPKVSSPNSDFYQRIQQFKSDSRLIINTGRLEHQKGQWLLIHAIKRLIDLNYNFKLIIFGEVKLRNLLTEIAHELSISEHIFFIGYVEDPFLYYELGDLFIMTSIYEGLPVAILEAMSNGLPVVSTDCIAGPCEILNPQKVFLYEKDEMLFDNKYGLLTQTPVKNYDIEINLAKNEHIVRELVEKSVMLLNDETLLNYYKKQSIIRSGDFNIQSIFLSWSKLVLDKIIK